MKFISLIILFLNVQGAFAKDFTTNSLQVKDAPEWVTQRVVERVSDKIENKLEWKIRRVPVVWHASHETYGRAHSLGPAAAAVTVKSDKKTEIHIGPNVIKADYAQILGHELVHVAFYQKYKGSIPEWLEEGFANFLSRKKRVDLNELKPEILPKDVTKLGHPFKGAQTNIHLQYKISQALVEMLDDKCDLDRLLRLSVRKKIETYIRNTCGITNINDDFKEWLSKNRKKSVKKK